MAGMTPKHYQLLSLSMSSDHHKEQQTLCCLRSGKSAGAHGKPEDATETTRLHLYQKNAIAA
jgi:hypothetical protein